MKKVAMVLMGLGLATALAGCATTGIWGAGAPGNTGSPIIIASETKMNNAIGQSMYDSDRFAMGNALSTMSNGQPFGWQNPTTGNVYKLLLTRTYVNDQGQPCRSYVLNAIIGGTAYTMRSTSCRVGGGIWQMVYPG